MADEGSSLTYADSGVDIAAGDALVARIGPLARATMRPGSLDGLGGFGGLFDLRAAGYSDPILVAATDGVGTKLRVAIDANNLSTIGVDLVAMCVNDLVCHGAEPLFFLDYYASGRLEVDRAQAVIGGIAEACRAVGCALIGGETAEMPGLYGGDDFDLAGFAVGAVERGEALPTAVAEGDVLLGLASHGVHANGFSLVREIVAREGLGWTDPAPFADQPLGDALLAPTALYVPAALAAVRAGGVNALAHITGGGILGNLPRVLPEGLGAEILLGAWELPAVFEWIADRARLDSEQMLGTFNCGIGMVLVVKQASAGSLIEVLRRHEEQVHVIGRVGEGHGVSLSGRAEVTRRVAILISGSGSNMVALVRSMTGDHPARPVLVLSDNPEALGLDRAQELGVTATSVERRAFGRDRAAFEAALARPLEAARPDFVCLAGFMRILSPDFVSRWAGRMMNIHPSLLPRYRGLNTHARAIAAGDAEAGCTVHEVTAALDDGPILGQGRVPILANDDPEALAGRVLEMEHKLYPAVLRRVAAGCRAPLFLG